MKKKFKFSILLWSLVFILGAIGFGGCSDDDEEDYIYEGSIYDYEPSNYVCIKITYSPANLKEYKPKKGDHVYFSPTDLPDQDYSEEKSVRFKIISATPNIIAMEWQDWYCKVKPIN